MTLLKWEKEQIQWLDQGTTDIEVLTDCVYPHLQEEFLKNLADMIHRARYNTKGGGSAQ